MKSFLGEVAQQLYSKYGDEVSSLSLLFPSRRARLFFLDELSQLTSRPIWQPQWLSLDDIFIEASALQIGERVRLIAELYKIYSKYHNEDFDKFYFWGEILLADFDMIDKYMVDAGALFRNAADIKELEADISYLTEEQLKIVAFWGSLGDDITSTDAKRNFLRIWASLASIYTEFRERLQQLGFAYTGMVQRQAIERLTQGESELDGARRYVIIGFNALSACERRLFDKLSKVAEVEFFWDYDNYYTHNREQEAGLFIRDNINSFPCIAPISHDNFNSDKQVTAVAAISNAVQCKYVAEIIKIIQAREGEVDKGTAIVLTDENLLLPLLYSLPEDIGGVNVTMGYPLRQSLAYSFLERLIELQQHIRRGGYYHQDVVGILSHPYIQGIDAPLMRQLIDEITKRRLIYVHKDMLAGNDILSAIFSPCEGWEAISKYLLTVIRTIVAHPTEQRNVREMAEFLSYIGDQISLLHNSITACEVEPLSLSIYFSLLRRHLQTLRIPYEGEPLEGVQVMGILETRCLDFRNVILLSMSDDNFPGNRTSQPSFVPQSLRSAYALPTPEHHEGVFGYYFYRLIQRAESIWMLYSSHADEKSTGEPSRYIYQLDYESRFNVKKVSVGVDVALTTSEPIVVEKSGRVAEQLARFTDTENPLMLSPTALFRYIACPMRFYFYSLASLRSDDELSDELDASMFGNILHGSLQELYRPLIKRADIGSLLREISDATIEREVMQAINEHFLKRKDAELSDYTGNMLLVKEIICKYIRRGVIAYDIDHPGFTVEGVEQRVEHPFTLPNGERVILGGIIDRIDRLNNGIMRVVDYKSSQEHLDFRSVEDLFNGKPKFRQSNIIQTMLYSLIQSKNHGLKLQPALYYVRSMHRKEFSPLLVDKLAKCKVDDFSIYSALFESFLNEKLTELFDRSIPFVQCEDRDESCTYCDYRAICKVDKA